MQQNRAEQGRLPRLYQSLCSALVVSTKNGNPTQSSKKPPLLSHWALGLTSLPSLRCQQRLPLPHSLPTAELETCVLHVQEGNRHRLPENIFRFSWQQITSKSKQHNNATFPPFIQSLLSVWRLGVDIRLFLMMCSGRNNVNRAAKLQVWI